MEKPRKISQLIMVWFLPLIIFGGIFFPLLGYIVFFMMMFMLVLSYFKNRFWCWHLCPRGAFLDLFLVKFSRKNKYPKIFSSIKFRWAFFVLFMAFFVFQLVISPKNLYAIGFVFVRMCLITTLIAIVLGIFLLERAWCAICPMGTLQNRVSQLNKKMPK